MSTYKRHVYVPVAFLTSYLKSSWVTRGRFIVLAPKKYDIVGRGSYGQSHLGIKCNDTVLVCYVGNIKHRKHGANQNCDRRIDGWWRWPEIR